MTKIDKVREMLAHTNDKQREKFIKRACKKDTEFINETYKFFQSHNTEADLRFITQLLIS